MRYEYVQIVAFNYNKVQDVVGKTDYNYKKTIVQVNDYYLKNEYYLKKKHSFLLVAFLNFNNQLVFITYIQMKIS